MAYGYALIPNLLCVAGAFTWGFTSLASVAVTNLGTYGLYLRTATSIRSLERQIFRSLTAFVTFAEKAGNQGVSWNTTEDIVKRTSSHIGNEEVSAGSGCVVMKQAGRHQLNESSPQSRSELQPRRTSNVTHDQLALEQV